ncbi:unnamed protein product [Camellia sinensis]
MGFLPFNYQLTICILYSLIFCFSSSGHNDESTALLQFKQSFSFNCSVSDRCSGSYNTDNWKEGTNCCAWDGVTCDDTTSHVIDLALHCNCLYGTIHPNSSLFNLVHLQFLDLSYNNFNHSQISPSFGRFTNLTHLYLYNSYLSGPIQSSEEEVWQGNNFSNGIFHLQKLQCLWLDHNSELTGKLPSFINGTLRHLRLLDLSETGFTGELPNSIGQLEYLEELHLRHCNLFGTIPTSLGNLTRLTRLDLGGNILINGTIPRSLTNLTQLTLLDLSYNNFEGPIPQLFPNFSQLCFIDFSNNQLTGPIPSSITGLSNLQSLNLGSNSINGTIPSSLFHLANFSQLGSINFSNNQLTGPIPSPITGLPNLQFLILGSNSINGTIPPSLFHLVNLTYLDLSSNNLSDTVEVELV